MVALNKIFQNLNYEDYFVESSLNEIFEKGDFKNTNLEDDVYLNVNPNNKTPYYPEFKDLIRLHFLVTKLKVIKAMEFGVGYSTSVIADALKNNKMNFSDKLDGIRTDKIFKLYSIDSSRKYINITKNNIDSDLLDYCSFHYTKVKTILLNNRVTTQYKKLPNIRPDFIYIDGPSQWDGISGNINGLNTMHKDRFPISSDIILLEYFLSPGTVIYIDGRTTNARFLLNNFQRNWDHHHFIEEDVHIFYLNEEPLGKLNKNHLDFIFNENI